MENLEKMLFKTHIASLKREAKHHRQYAKLRKGEIILIECIMRHDEEIKTLEGKIRTLKEENHQLKTKKK